MNKNNKKNATNNIAKKIHNYLSKNAEKIFIGAINIILIASILFCLTTLSFHADISLLAFPISLIITFFLVFVGYYKFLKNKDCTRSNIFLKLVQYIPLVFLLCFVLRRAGKFGTYKWLDAVSVILWCIIFILSLVINHYMNPKRFISITSSWNVSYKKPEKYTGGKYIFFEIVDWIDALIQAIFMVLLIQIFFFQLYVIPSESMVGEFLIGDKVIVTKCNCGPKFPLTDIGFPTFTDYKRGDVVVLRNPKYTIDRHSEVKSVASHLIYMLSLTTINLNKDENGNIKYDPLVKRICGEQGEQLVMLDGTLYARTKDNPEFTPMQIDNKYALWNINDILPTLKSGQKVKTDLTYLSYEQMLDFEQERRNFDLDNAVVQVNEILNSIKQSVGNKMEDYGFVEPDLNNLSLYRQFNLLASDILTNKSAFEWFSSFISSWIPNIDKQRDMYQDCNYKLNIMLKLKMGQLLKKYAEYMKKGASFGEALVQDDCLVLKDEFETINYYIFQNDQRNMPVFPASLDDGTPQYIPDNCYFMMGDNRFNSEDLRHSSDYSEVKLTTFDPQSVIYYSNMNPVYINDSLIEGKPILKFWPTNRISKVRAR